MAVKREEKGRLVHSKEDEVIIRRTKKKDKGTNKLGDDTHSRGRVLYQHQHQHQERAGNVSIVIVDLLDNGGCKTPRD